MSDVSDGLDRSMTEMEKLTYERTKSLLADYKTTNLALQSRASFTLAAATALFTAIAIRFGSIEGDKSLGVLVCFCLAGLAYTFALGLAAYAWRARRANAPGSSRMIHTVGNYIVCGTEAGWTKMMVDLENVIAVERTANDRLGTALNALIGSVAVEAFFLVVALVML